ncbi:hypothetical protein H3S74_12140 [Gilliamella sp. W8126]|uniref:hypothetical protein n=1 Tax=Gilliamella sp. W8126 TaxID=2750946 RepID=UPI0018DB2392|nr:hypothetical protein [Gilliamella sp. W8126]MBI0006979.1 hypothetical protein [Gilliamella sp. W8126]
MINLKSYANSIIYALELKKQIKAQPLNGKQLGIVLSYIEEYLINKKSGIKGTIEILNQDENELELEFL